MPTNEPSIGELLAGRYELRKRLGESATRVAYRAFDQEVEAEVTLWWLRPELFPSAAHRAAFERSALELRKPVSPHLLRLFDAGRGEHNGQGLLYLTMQRGTTAQLEEHLSAGVVASPGRVRLYAEALAAALDAAHSSGRHHGWIEPRDVVEVAGQIKLGGVGLFGAMQASTAIEQWGHSKRYLAPELLAGTSTSPACDWYSVAAILVDLASGRAAGSFEESKEQLAVRNPAQLNALSAALSERPSDRPADGTAFLAVLSEAWPSDNIVVTKQEEVQTDLRAKAPERELYDADFDGPGARIDSVSFLDDDEEGTLVRESSGSRARTLVDPEETGETLDGEVGAPNHGVTLEEVEVRDDDTVDDSSGSRLKMVSMKPEDAAGPATGPIKSPVKPVLRPLSSLVDTPEPTNLGNIAPPKQQKRSLLPFVLLGAAVVIAGIVIAVIVLSTSSVEEEQPSVPDEVLQPAPATVMIEPQLMRIATPPPAGPCPKDMAELAVEGLCIDRFESPGEGLQPQTSLSLEAAREACLERSTRLCSAVEWETACRGENGASWPYAHAFREEICNIRGGEIEVAGQRAECHNHLGIFDMSGNTAEWVEEGQIRGGSAADESEARCSQRRPNAERQTSYSDVGFRCCTEAIASQEASD